MVKKMKKAMIVFLIALLLLPPGWGLPVVAKEDIPVLLYHQVVDDPSNEWTHTSTELFRETMRYLQDNNFTTLTAEQYVNIMDGVEQAPENPILLTFDDATPDFVDTVVPILDEFDMSAVQFVTTDWIGGGFSMSEDQLKSLVGKDNISLQVHSTTHDGEIWGENGAVRSEITMEEAQEQIGDAVTYLKELTGEDPTLMAYPYGSYNHIAKEVNKENGIKYAFKVGYPDDGDYALGRHYVMKSTTLENIAEWIGGPVPQTPSPEDNEDDQDGDSEAIFVETFNDGQGMAVQSGSPSIKEVSTKVFDGNEDGHALYLSNRSQSHDAIDYNFDTLGMENGKTYSITVNGYVDEGEEIPEGAQAVLLTVDSYSWKHNLDYNAGQAFTLTAEFTVDEADKAFRIQSNDAGAKVPFYIGHVEVREVATADPVEPEPTIVYHETFGEGMGIATPAGSELIPVSDVIFDGNDNGFAVHVTSRTEGWNGIDVPFSHVNMEDGKTYNITIQGYVSNETTVPDGAEALLQNIQSYNGLYVNTDMVAGEPFTLSGKYTVNTEDDNALRIQTNDAGEEVPFYIGDILITAEDASNEEPDPDLPPAKDFQTITFEDGELNGFEPRGGNEELTVTTEANHTEGGSYALKVENREQAWNGPSLRVEEYINIGQEYNVSAWIKLISPDSSQIQLSTQIGDGDGASYNTIEAKTISQDDGWVKFEGTYRYTSSGSGHITIYVESSNNADATFYIDDVSFEPTGSGAIDFDRSLTPIKDVYKDDFLIGNIVSEKDLEGLRLEFLKHHHEVVTAENAMKPSYAYNDEGELDLIAERELVDSVLANDLQMVGHVLVWHSQSPEWLWADSDGKPLSRDDALQNMRRHITAAVEAIGDDVIAWDVVNEAMSDNPSNPSDWRASLRQSGWYHAIGPDFIEQAFRITKEVMQKNGWDDVKLYYNDYNDDNQNKAEAIYQMVKEINEEYAAENNGEVLIDGIGMQGHYNESTNPENVRRSIEKFSSLEGVEISVTELDIQFRVDEFTEREANRQAYLYAQLFQIYKEHAEDIARVTFWGLDDATSWRGDRDPLLFDKDFKAKPAYYAVVEPEEFIENYDPEADFEEAQQGKAAYGTPTIDGIMDDAWIEAPELPIDRYQTAHNGATGTARVLWDDEYLYVFAQVSDSNLDKVHEDAHEQDSVEVFIDEQNTKESYYVEGVGQYRVNFDNETSFNPSNVEEGVESATRVSGGGYTVELKIPFKTITPEDSLQIGFDIQINDAVDGARNSVATWNDTSGQGFQDPSVFGVLTLVDSLDKPEDPKPQDPKPEEPKPQVPADKPVVTKPIMKDKVATVDNNAVESVPKNGKLVLDLTDNDSTVTVRLTKEQIQQLREHNAEIIIEKEDVKLEIPLSILTVDDKAVEIDIQNMKDIDEALSAVYDFTIIQNGKVISKFDMPITLTFPVEVDRVNNPNNVKVFYWNADTEEWEVVGDGGQYENGFIIVETDHFSTFTVFEVEDEAGEIPAPTPQESDDDSTTEDDSSSGDGKKLPATATSTYNLLLLGLVMLVAGSAFLFIRRKRA